MVNVEESTVDVVEDIEGFEASNIYYWNCYACRRSNVVCRSKQAIQSWSPENARRHYKLEAHSSPKT
nr:hypothetical protein Itr_chr08CG14200 [Ipomoea trifida]